MGGDLRDLVPRQAAHVFHILQRNHGSPSGCVGHDPTTLADPAPMILIGIKRRSRGLTPIKDGGHRNDQNIMRTHVSSEALMRLYFLIYTLVSTALAGVGIIAVLAAGLDGWEPIVIAAAIGAVAALPAAWVATEKIRAL
jgi:hypothetical protein